MKSNSNGPQAHAHVLVAETAKAMAHELYSELMTWNDWYRAWRSANVGAGAKALEERWVNAHWGSLLGGARAVLAGMLGNPLIDPAQKTQIYDALVLDATLKRGRGEGHLLSQELQ